MKDDGISVYVDNQDSDHHTLSKNFKLTLIITKKYSSNLSEKKNIEKVSVSTTKASISEFEQSSHALPQANASTSKSSTTKRSSTNPASISKSSLPTPVNSKAGSSQHFSSVCQFKNKVSVAVFKKGKIPVLFYPDPVKDFAEIVKAEVLEEQVFSNNVVIKEKKKKIRLREGKIKVIFTKTLKNFLYEYFVQKFLVFPLQHFFKTQIRELRSFLQFF